MKRWLMLLLVILQLVCGSVSAQVLPFRDDYQAINQAAGSVLMLLVYDQEEGGYTASGSGFVAFDSSTLITNYHVVEGGDLVLAEADDGRSYFLDQVVVADKERDIAILRFKSPTSLLPLTLDEDMQRLRGQPVVAIGSPEGFRNTVSKGDISALFSEQGVRYIQFTAPISSGSSGGALFSNQGQVIGITTSSVMGESQNLNFAIDIREAIALYQAADPGGAYAISQLDGVVAKPSPGGQTRPAPDPSGSISGFAAVETKPGQVRLSWNSELPAGQTFFIGYEIEGNPYYNFLSTQQHTALVTDLVPGQDYLFYIAKSEDALDAPLYTTSLRLPEAQPYKSREARLLTSGVYLLPQDVVIKVPLPPALKQLAASQLTQATSGGDQAFMAVYRMALAAGSEAATGDILYVLTTPGGTLYSQAYLYNYDARAAAYLRSADLGELIEEVLDMEGALQTGTWQLSIYHDAQLLAQSSFELLKDDATAQTDNASPASLLAPQDLRASLNEKGLGLRWQPVFGAKAYHIYRAAGKDGVFFYKGISETPAFLDSMAVKGREYSYQVEAVGAEAVSPRSETLVVVVVDESEISKDQPALQQTGRQPAYPLDLGDEAYVGNIIRPYINPDIVNLSTDKTVTGFTLAFYCENSQYEALMFEDSEKSITYYTYDIQVGPGQTVNPGEVALSGYGINLHYIYLAISEVRLQDGEVIKVSPQDLDFYYWELDGM